MDYGKRFKFYRNKAKLTQKEAAKLIGINDYQLGNYETGRSEPSLDILKKMSKAYNISIDQMLGNKPSPINSDLIDTEDSGPDYEEVVSNIKKYIDEFEKSKM